MRKKTNDWSSSRWHSPTYSNREGQVSREGQSSELNTRCGILRKCADVAHKSGATRQHPVTANILSTHLLADVSHEAGAAQARRRRPADLGLAAQVGHRAVLSKRVGKGVLLPAQGHAGAFRGIQTPIPSRWVQSRAPLAHSTLHAGDHWRAPEGAVAHGLQGIPLRVRQHLCQEPVHQEAAVSSKGAGLVAEHVVAPGAEGRCNNGFLN